MPPSKKHGTTGCCNGNANALGQRVKSTPATTLLMMTSSTCAEKPNRVVVTSFYNRTDLHALTYSKADTQQVIRLAKTQQRTHDSIKIVSVTVVHHNDTAQNSPRNFLLCFRRSSFCCLRSSRTSSSTSSTWNRVAEAMGQQGMKHGTSERQHEPAVKNTSVARSLL